MNQGRRKKKKKWPWILLLLVAAAIFTFLQLRGTVRQGYKEAQAAQRDIATYYTFSGNLTPVLDEIQTSKEQLKVKEVYVAQGDLVRENDPLLRATDGTRVTARSPGTLETLFVEADDTLQPGGQIARIVDYDRLEVSVDVDEYDIGALKIGKQGEVYINALDLKVPGSVREIAREATLSGGVSFYGVKLQISAEDNIRSGMSAEVKILKEEAKGVLSLNLNVISFDDDNNPYVLVRENEKDMVRRYIVIGVSDGVYVQIISGLQENETVYYADMDMMRFFGPPSSFRSGRE